MGPFFSQLGQWLEGQGKRVWKVNFNGGDEFYYDLPGTTAFHGPASSWSDFLAQVIRERKINAVVVFGDERVYHRKAHVLCKELGIAYFAFEEGYLRPNWITLEPNGVNGRSGLPRNPGFYEMLAPAETMQPQSTVPGFLRNIVICSLYAWAFWLGRTRFPHYRHHRNMHPIVQGTWFWFSWGRKLAYLFKDDGVYLRLHNGQLDPFYLVVLQVHNDAQIRAHSRYADNPAFIEEVMTSFAAHAPPHSHLLIKHHPMDRGYTNYRRLIGKLARKLGLGARVLYIHDVRLPVLLSHAAGVITINSTVGLSAVLHGCPVLALGQAIYAMPGLTFQGEMDAFWKDARAPSKGLFRLFQQHLIATTQLNGCFYGNKQPWMQRFVATHGRREERVVSLDAQRLSRAANE